MKRRNLFRPWTILVQPRILINFDQNNRTILTPTPLDTATKLDEFLERLEQRLTSLGSPTHNGRIATTLEVSRLINLMNYLRWKFIFISSKNRRLYKNDLPNNHGPINIEPSNRNIQPWKTLPIHPIIIYWDNAYLDNILRIYISYAFPNNLMVINL